MNVNSTPDCKASLAARVLRAVPVYSGCGKIANKAILAKWLGSGGPNWVKLRWGSEVQCYFGDYIGRALYYFGDLDPKLSWVFREFVKEGDTVIDVGANVGLLTTLASNLVGSSGRVLAVEPQPRALSCLDAALEKNGCENVTVARCGVADQPGTLVLHVPEGNMGGASFREDCGDEAEAVEVPVKTLAEVISECDLPVARLVKLDVEGYEAEVIEGVREVWKKAPPEVVIFEHREETPVQKHRVGSLLRDLGYRFYRLPSHLFRGELVPEEEAQDVAKYSHDLVAIHQDSDYLLRA